MTVIELDLPSAVPADARAALLTNLWWTTSGITGVEVVDAGGGAAPRLRVGYAGPRPADDVAAELARDVAAIVADAERFTPVVTYERPVDGPGTAADPYPELVARGWAAEELPGVHGYAGPLAALYQALDATFAARLRSLGAVDVVIPSLLATGTLLAAGQLRTNPHQANFVFHLDERRSVVDDVAAGATTEPPALDLGGVPGTSRRPEAVLSPAACQPLYRAMRGEVLPGPRVLTGLARCHRYESGATAGMRRCREFAVREVVCVGTAGDVAAFRSSLLDLAAALLDDLAVGGRIATACDPFFTDAYAGGRGYQLSFAVKHEIQAAVPHDGSALAVGSVNHHGDHFGRTWAIATPEGTAHSCCLGFGLDRWCYALVAQHGVDPAAWPRRLQDALAGRP